MSMTGWGMSDFTAVDYQRLSYLFHGYTGYRPNVSEIPNGDGKVDATKRYLHVAPKYNPPESSRRIYARAFTAACHVAEALGLPPELRPSVNACALRVLEYPPGAGSERHTDFDMFTLNLWRSEPVPGMEARDVAGYSVHLGELAELFGVGKAEPHEVPALDRAQYSMVFFALPDPSVMLPGPVFTGDSVVKYMSVGQWLAERMSRSRVYK